MEKTENCDLDFYLYSDSSLKTRNVLNAHMIRLDKPSVRTLIMLRYFSSNFLIDVLTELSIMITVAKHWELIDPQRVLHDFDPVLEANQQMRLIALEPQRLEFFPKSKLSAPCIAIQVPDVDFVLIIKEQVSWVIANKNLLNAPSQLHNLQQD